MSVETYVPTKPYFIKSGTRIGRSLEELMFENYFWLAWMLKKMDAGLKKDSQINEFHTHLRWILLRGEDRVLVRLCPHCGAEAIKFFSYSYAERKYFVSCGGIICKGKILSRAVAHPLKFSSILELHVPSPLVAVFLKNLFFPDCENPTADQLFGFFAEKSSA